MILLDIEKAYDTVWITGPLNKLVTFKLPAYLLLILKAVLEEHKFSVHVNEASSIKTTPGWVTSGSGVLQHSSRSTSQIFLTLPTLN